MILLSSHQAPLKSNSNVSQFDLVILQVVLPPPLNIFRDSSWEGRIASGRPSISNL